MPTGRVMAPTLFSLLRLQAELRREAGQTMAEYGILLAVVTLIVVLAATVLGGNVSSIFSSTGGKV